MSCKTGNAESRATFFRHSAALLLKLPNDAMGSSPKSTAHINPTSGSACALPPQPGREIGPNLPQQEPVHCVNSTVCTVVVVSSLVSVLRPVGFVSVVVSSTFQIELCGLPDQDVVDYVMEGLKHGFWIGCSLSFCRLKLAYTK